jgi:acid phosphatase (class A)
LKNLWQLLYITLNPTESNFMKNRRHLLSMILLLLAATAARAEKLNFLSETAVDPVKLLPAPASRDSEEVKAELDAMVAIQATRTKEQVARCCSEVKPTIAEFQDVLGPWFTPENLPKLARLLKKAEHDSKYFVGAAKVHFDRKRPYDEDSRIHPATELENTPAYPSGHATRGLLDAKILAKLAPRRRAELLERGRQIGWDRVIAGVHHPSDIVAGRVLGQAVAQALFDCKQFQDEFDAAKAEFDAVQSRQAEPAGVGND